MKSLIGKEHLIGFIIGIIISVAGGFMSLKSDDIKAGICGSPSISIGSPAPAPSASP